MLKFHVPWTTWTWDGLGRGVMSDLFCFLFLFVLFFSLKKMFDVLLCFIGWKDIVCVGIVVLLVVYGGWYSKKLFGVFVGL